MSYLSTHNVRTTQEEIFDKISPLLSHLDESQVCQLVHQIYLYNNGTELKIDLSHNHAITIGVDRGVMPPISSLLLAQHIYQECTDLLNGSVVWDIGTGSGIQSIAALYAKASKVCSTDITSLALQNARKNIELLADVSKVEFVQADLFDNSKLEGKCDVILFTPPYFFGCPIKEYPVTIGMLNNSSIAERFLNEALKHLNPDGKILTISWDFSGKENCVLTQAEKTPNIKIDYIKEIKNEDTEQKGTFKITQLSILP